MPPLPELDLLLIWGLFTRGLGVVFLISFVSLATQVREGAGRESAMPIARRLEKIAEDFPTWRRFLYFPTLLWIDASDATLRALPYVGMGAAALVVYGGPFGFWGLVVCYLVYLTLDLAVGLIFPWDSLLFEATVLGLFLPPIAALPELAAVTTPAPALAWAYRLLLFRLMFGFGKQKFLGSRPKDLAYLKGFLVGQPLPSAAGWYMQKLPAPLLKGAVLFMFFTEIPAPFFAFFPGPLSLVFAVCTVLLMIGIQLMGSFGYFSLLTIVSCLPLLDNTTPLALDLGTLFDAGEPRLVNAFVVVHTLAASVAFVFNSWMGQSWHLWAFWYQLPRIAQVPLTFFRLLHPFRWLHPYGVFPPNNWPAAKMSLLFEVTWDGKKWHELRFKYSACHPSSFPKFVAPHHPRGDQAVIYETMGLNPTSLVSSLMGSWDPYPFGSASPAAAVSQHLLHGRAFDFFSSQGFVENEGPPVSVRITTIMLEPVSLKEHRETGNWWKRTYVGPHMPPQRQDPDFWKVQIGEPEFWHFDAIFWRRRSRLRKLMDAAVRPDADPMQLVRLDRDELTEADVERFWNEFVPMIAGPTRETFETLPDVVPAVRQRFSRREQRALYLLLQRFSLLLVSRLEPLYLHRGFRPRIPVKTYFHLWMLAQHVIGNGREAYLAAFADPLSIAQHVPALTNQTGLYALSIFRYEEMIFEAQKLRLITAYVYPHDTEMKRAIAEKVKASNLETLAPLERLFVRVAQGVSGFFNVLPDIRDNFKGPRFDQGYPERYPEFRELDSGEVVVSAYAPEDGAAGAAEEQARA
jgi:hypothetical protein